MGANLFALATKLTENSFFIAFSTNFSKKFVPFSAGLATSQTMCNRTEFFSSLQCTHERRTYFVCFDLALDVDVQFSRK